MVHTSFPTPFKRAKKEERSMTKTLCSISLLLLASGWLSILPAQTKANYRCDYCNKEFSSKSEESQKCPQNNKPGNQSPTKGQHKLRLFVLRAGIIVSYPPVC